MLPESVTVADKIKANVMKPSFFKSLSPGETWKSQSMRKIPEEFVRSTDGAFEHRVVCSVRWGNSWQFWLKREENGLFMIEEDWNEFMNDNPLSPTDSLLFTHDDAMFLEVRIFKNNGGDEIMTFPFGVQPEPEPEPVSPNPQNFDDHQAATAASTSGSVSAKGGPNGTSATVENPERYLLNPQNPFFVKTVTKRNDVLYVSRVAISKYGLKFGPDSSTIYYLLHGEEKEEAKLKFYSNRPVFRGWDKLCRRHNVKIGDKVVCELELTGGVVAAVRVHFVK